MLEVGLMPRAGLSLPPISCLALSKGPGGQDLFPSHIYLEPNTTEEVDKAWFIIVAPLSSREEKGRNKGEFGIGPMYSTAVCQSVMPV